ncbi:exo-alpha-sialidase [Williamsia sp.]|uniref:WD40/YVTN/BNR-like repeat-containing protein n=1 Tax=Williamsia sp. TaxID=1872085 RepID=UPI002F92D0EF
MTSTVRWRRILPMAVLGAATLILVGCTTGDPAGNSTRQPPSPTGAPIEAAALSPPLTHLHGLHVTADQTLLAGTHTGLVVIDPSGATTPVGTSDDDLMGLSGLPGTDTIFASGHPGPSSSASNPLGLRVSSDGGHRWDNRSLSGQVDFHVLAAASNLLIGSDGGPNLLISSDTGGTWTRGAQLIPRTLAISADGIWAATEQGVVWHSTDGGRSFVRIAAPTTIGLLAGNGAALWAVDVDGYAWQRFEGQAWRKHSWIGATEAMAVGPDGTVYAATSAALQVLVPDR